MTAACDYQLRDLIERLDRCELSASDEAATVLHELRLRNGENTMNSPVFIAKFSDGEVPRMTVFTSLKNLDVERGLRLARHAYRSRRRQNPPAIVAAQFEQDGNLLGSYSAVGLEDLDADRQAEEDRRAEEDWQAEDAARTTGHAAAQLAEDQQNRDDAAHVAPESEDSEEAPL